MNGIPLSFLTYSWEVVGQSISNLVNEFLGSEFLPNYLTHACLVMIPKGNTPMFLANFQPISLCSIVHKIFAKMICNRLANLLLKLIIPNQSAFVIGRSIFDNIHKRYVES